MKPEAIKAAIESDLQEALRKEAIVERFKQIVEKQSNNPSASVRTVDVPLSPNNGDLGMYSVTRINGYKLLDDNEIKQLREKYALTEPEYPEQKMAIVVMAGFAKPTSLEVLSEIAYITLHEDGCVDLNQNIAGNSMRGERLEENGFPSIFWVASPYEDTLLSDDAQDAFWPIDHSKVLQFASTHERFVSIEAALDIIDATPLLTPN